MEKFGKDEDYWLDMDGAKSWAWFNYARMNQASEFGGGMKIVGLGYVAQERERLKELKKQTLGIPTKPKK